MSHLGLSYSLAAALIVYSYFIYPMLLRIIAPRFGRFEQGPPELNDDALPTITFVIAAHNEELEIRARIENLLQMDYPSHLVEILIASDGSSDATFAIANSFADLRVSSIEHHPNVGKSATLNQYIPKARGSILIMSDANTYFARDAARRLVRWFSDSNVSAVSGKLSLLDPKTGNNVDSAYWRYETQIKALEGMLGAKLGGNGAIYAFRKADFVPFPNNTIVDDFVIPMLIKLTHGGRITFDSTAVATEPTPEAISDEYHRRVRIGTGAYQSLTLLWPLALPQQGWTSFCFISHKLLRWLTPLLLVFMFIVSLSGLGSTWFQILLVLELLFVATACAGLRIKSGGTLARLLRTMSMFAVMNVALLIGFWRFVTQKQSGTWKRTSRGQKIDA